MNPFQLFCTRIGVGFGQAYSVPVFASLLTDTYPIQGRARVYSLYWMSQPIGLLLGPFVAGAIADGVGRHRRLALDVHPARDPAAAPRDRSRSWCCANRRAAATSRSSCSARCIDAVGGTRPSCRSRCRRRTPRLKKIKTFYFICVGIGVLGFALVAVPVQLGLLLDDSYGYGAYTRGWMLSLTAIASLVAIPIAGLDRTTACSARIPELRRAPRGQRSSSATACCMLIAMRMKEPALLLIGVALAGACTSAAFVSVGPIVGAVAPYRMRTQAFALIPVFIFLMGGFFGGIIAGALSDAHGERTALTIVAPIAGTIGGAALHVRLALPEARHLARGRGAARGAGGDRSA